MMYKLLLPLFLISLLNACAINENGTIADLRGVDVEVADVRIEGGLEKAIDRKSVV